MIDIRSGSQRLLDRLQPVLPLPARMTPELVAALGQGHEGITPACTISLDQLRRRRGRDHVPTGLGRTTERKTAIHASITHLRFDPRLPPARDISVYQKHRLKALRRQPR